MPRPKRAEGTISDEWYTRIQAVFDQHPHLTVPGVAAYLSDIAQEWGQNAVSPGALYIYKSPRARRNPPERFKTLWAVFEERLAALEGGSALAVKEADGRHILAVIDGRAETIWLPKSSEWAIRRCCQCQILFIGMHNARRCPACRH